MTSFDCCAFSEPAENHEQNQDSYAIDARRGVFIVADGMGGRPGGADASRLAVQEMMDRVRFCSEDRKRDEAFLMNAVRSVGLKIRELAERNEMMAGMGTTMTAAVLYGEHGRIVHVGDSRAYLFRDSRLIQITRDHSAISELIQRNLLTADEAANHPLRHVLTQALGVHKNIKPDLYDLSFAPGDYLVLATDGLTRVLAPADIEQLIAYSKTTAEGLCEKIRGIVRQNGLPDDFTVVIVRFAVDGDSV